MARLRKCDDMPVTDFHPLQFDCLSCGATAGKLCRDDDGRGASLWQRRVRGHSTDHLLPDLENSATLGCLLALVRASWCDPHICTHYHAPGDEPDDGHRPGAGWTLLSGAHDVLASVGWHPTEAEALVAALEGAPGTRP